MAGASVVAVAGAAASSPNPPASVQTTAPEKIFRCPTCDRVFNKKANLTVHRRIHTGEKPYKCSVQGCGKRFMWKSSVTFHEQNCNPAAKPQNKRSAPVVDQISSSSMHLLSQSHPFPHSSLHSYSTQNFNPTPSLQRHPSPQPQQVYHNPHTLARQQNQLSFVDHSQHHQPQPYHVSQQLQQPQHHQQQQHVGLALSHTAMPSRKRPKPSPSHNPPQSSRPDMPTTPITPPSPKRIFAKPPLPSRAPFDLMVPAGDATVIPPMDREHGTVGKTASAAATSAPQTAQMTPTSSAGVLPGCSSIVALTGKIPINMDLGDSDDESDPVGEPLLSSGPVLGAQDAFMRTGNPFKGFAPKCSPLPASSPIIVQGIGAMPLSPLFCTTPPPTDSHRFAPDPIEPCVSQPHSANNCIPHRW